LSIHPTAEVHRLSVVEEGAVIGPGCRIGPFAVVGAQVRLGRDVELKSHAVVDGNTEIGDGTVIFPFASIGHVPQDLKYRGEKTSLVIGARNRIREHATMNPGTAGGGGETRVGDDNLFMMSTHIGHDCRLGSRIVMANNATLGGHVAVGDNVVIGGLAGVHQFCRIGQGAMIGFLAAVVADVVPYGMVAGERAVLGGLNLVGLRRRGTDSDHIHGLRAAYRAIFESENGDLASRVESAREEFAGNPLVAELTRFMQGETSRAFTLPAAG
jgi:UDP-N-acetylglucosamine acyltransferase